MIAPILIGLEIGASPTGYRLKFHRHGTILSNFTYYRLKLHQSSKMWGQKLNNAQSRGTSTGLEAYIGNVTSNSPFKL